MKKLFNIIGLVSLILISFIYTEKSMTVVREYDSIMIKINEQKDIPSIKATIVDDTIIPGILKKQVNKKESYKKMKQYGYYNNNLLIYKKIDNKDSLKNNFDKYIIGGNSTKNMVSLIFVLNWNSNIEKIKTILDKYNIKGNFVVSDKIINKDIIQTLVKNNHILINRNEEESKFKDTNIVIKNVYNQKKQYFYLESKNKNIMKMCEKNNNHIILPSKINSDLIINTKKELHAGSILSYEANNNLINELETIIKYIENKGFKVTNLIEHLEE